MWNFIRCFYFHSWERVETIIVQTWESDEHYHPTEKTQRERWIQYCTRCTRARSRRITRYKYEDSLAKRTGNHGETRQTHQFGD